MNFNEWTRVEKRYNRRGYRHDHKVSFWSTKQRSTSDKKRFSCNISKDLIDEVGANVFSLYEKNGVFAFVPNKRGEFKKVIKGSVVTGITNEISKNIITACGGDPNSEKVMFDAVVIDGAIMFPKDKAEAMALIY